MNENKNVKKLPYGISDFRHIMLNNYAYLDKTRYIEMLEKESNPNKFIIRPPGFGKSLFLSTLESYYDVKQKNDFEQLFGGLYIGQHPTPERNSYAVLKFDFSGIDSFDSERFAESFSQNVRETVCNFLDNYRDYIPNIDHEIQLIKNYSDCNNILQVATDIVSRNKMRTYLLIDEYDHFARHLVATGKYLKDEWKERYGSYIKVRNFYLGIKSTLFSCIYRTFIAGVSYAAWEGQVDLMTDDLSEDQRYNEIMGFIEEESQRLYVEAKDHMFDHEKEEIDWWYNGYNFSTDTDKSVYNPEMVIYYLQNMGCILDKPDVVNEKEAASYLQLQRLMQNEKTCSTILEIAKNNKIKWYRNHNYLMEDLTDENNLVSLLLNLGLLMVDKRELASFLLKPSNYFARCVLNYFIFAKRNSENHEKVLFLDIDGVLQPYGAQDRFKHIKEADEFNRKLLDEFSVDYSRYNVYDVMAVYYDWDKGAVAELKRILDTTGAKIVLSSDWRDKTIYRMADLCRIHGLDGYLIDATPSTEERNQRDVENNPEYKQMIYRAIEISMYVNDHPEIKNYVAIDDMHLIKDLGEKHAVETSNKMTKENADKCIELLMEDKK
jgi:hypothetical protein